MSSPTRLRNPIVRRFSQVYVEIPPSPLHKSWTDSTSALHVSTVSANRKENAPLQANNMFQTQPSTSGSQSRKRKLSESNSTNMVVVEIPALKKPKVAPGKKGADKPKATQTKTSAAVPRGHPSEPSEEYPNGWFYCHQCNKKRDSAVGIQCTIKDPIHTRCRVKFCTACLKNRQGEHVAEIKAAGKYQDDTAHVANENYIWKCPKCKDVCNCARCRKAKGLEPTGNLTTVARRDGKGSAAAMLSENPARLGILPGKGAQLTPAAKKPKTLKTASAVEAGTLGKPKAKPGRKPKPKIKPLPILTWTKVPLDGLLSLSEAESRIQIREFVLRFACIMDTKNISRKLLEELEGIGGESSKGRGKDWDSDVGEEDEDFAGWVSESCVKGVIMGLLGLVHNDESDNRDKKLIGDAIKNLRATGVNLTKVWGILASLRDSLAESTNSSDATESLSNLPEPLPPPASVTYRNTRATRTGNTNITFVSQSNQMVPVLVALTEVALQTDVVRAEIEEGVKEGKDKIREGRDGVKLEHDRWEKIKELEKDPKTKEAKEKRDAHKCALQHLDESLKVAMNAYAPRFSGPLGKDMDGRLYWALSPGVTERDYAIQSVIENAVEDGKDGKGKKLRRNIPNDDERRGMKKWSWFVAVWGKKPDIGGEVERMTIAKAQKDDGSDSEEDADDEDWWGFWDSAEIQKVADWIEIRAGLDLEQKDKKMVTTDASNSTLLVDTAASSRASSPLSIVSDDEDTGGGLYSESSSKQELKALVKGLKEYATLLEWRMKEDDGDNSVKASGKGTVSASKFYN